MRQLTGESKMEPPLTSRRAADDGASARKMRRKQWMRVFSMWSVEDRTPSTQLLGSYPKLPTCYEQLWGADGEPLHNLYIFPALTCWHRECTADGVTYRHRVEIRPEALELAQHTIFDPPAGVTFDNLEQARTWCDSVNERLGYQRFFVVTISDDAAGETPERKTGS